MSLRAVSSRSRWLQVQGILRQYERITLCLHFCIYLLPFSPGLALRKTTDFSEEFSGLNICSLMLLGEHGSAERRRAVAAIQGRRTLAFILSMPGFLQFSSSMPPRLQCVYFQPRRLFLAVTAQRRDSARRIKDKMGFNF